MRAEDVQHWARWPMPESRTTVALDRAFSSDEVAAIRLGFVPESMDDKWFIYWRDRTLRFHRSWTGFCIYIVRFEPARDGARMVEALVNRDPAQYSADDDERDASLISYLIDVLLLDSDGTYPSRAGQHPGLGVMELWSVMGRSAFGDLDRRRDL